MQIDRRLADRVTRARREVRVKLAEREIMASIIDLSLTGVAFETKENLPMESLVSIGRMRAVIVRREGKIYGLQLMTNVDLAPLEDEETAA